MAKVLHIDSSGRKKGSVSREFSKEVVDTWLSHHPEDEHIYRDLMESDLRFVDSDWIEAAFSDGQDLSPKAQEHFDLSNSLVDELLAAETLVIGMPMYNFGVPAVFKAYVDQVSRAGRTFSYQEGQPKGLLKTKRAIIVTASASDFSQEAYKHMNFLDPYIKAVLGFLGIKDIHIINLTGRDAESIAAAKDSARQKLKSILSIYRHVAEV